MIYSIYFVASLVSLFVVSKKVSRKLHIFIFALFGLIAFSVEVFDFENSRTRTAGDLIFKDLEGLDGAVLWGGAFALALISCLFSRNRSGLDKYFD